MAGRYLQDLILDGKATSSQEQKVECVSSPYNGRTNEFEIVIIPNIFSLYPLKFETDQTSLDRCQKPWQS